MVVRVSRCVVQVWAARCRASAALKVVSLMVGASLVKGGSGTV